MKTRDKVMALHEGGLSNAEIARTIGVSRQRVWDVLRPRESEQLPNLSASTSTRSASEKAEDKPMSIASVAAALGVHPNTVRRWSDRGTIPCFRLGTRQDRRFEPKRVVEIMYSVRQGDPKRYQTIQSSVHTQKLSLPEVRKSPMAKADGKLDPI